MPTWKTALSVPATVACDISDPAGMCALYQLYTVVNESFVVSTWPVAPFAAPLASEVAPGYVGMLPDDAVELEPDAIVEADVAAAVGADVAPPEALDDCVVDEDEDEEPWLHAASANKATTAMRDRVRIVTITPIVEGEGLFRGTPIR